MSKTLVGSFLLSSAVAIAALGCLSLHAQARAPARVPSAGARLLEHSSEGDAKSDAVPRVEIAQPSIELAELRIVGRRVSRSHKVAPASRPPSRELIPCSDWEELGPVFGARAGEVPRTRHVRRLCAAP